MTLALTRPRAGLPHEAHAAALLRALVGRRRLRALRLRRHQRAAVALDAERARHGGQRAAPAEARVRGGARREAQAPARDQADQKPPAPAAEHRQGRGGQGDRVWEHREEGAAPAGALQAGQRRDQVREEEEGVEGFELSGAGTWRWGRPCAYTACLVDGFDYTVRNI